MVIFIKLLSILVLSYALWRIYVNYKSDIKIGSEISLAVGSILTFIGNIYFKDSLLATIFQLALTFLITLHLLRTTRKAN